MGNLISIIIPAYNAEKYIENCLESCLNQSYKNIEVIVVNDGSTDKTAIIVENYSSNDSRIKIVSTENGGVSRARNIGIDASNGDYLTFVDADDRLLPNALEIMLKVLHENSADIVAAKTFAMQIGEQKNIPESSYNTEIWQNYEAVSKSLDDHPATYSAVAKIYKKEALKGVRFPEGYKIHEDSYFIFELLASCPRMVVLDAYVYKVYLSPNSASRSGFSDKYFDILRILQKKIDFINAELPQFKNKVSNLSVKAHMALLYNLCKTYNKIYREKEKQSLREIKRLKKYFKPAKKIDEKWFKIITFNLYQPYKLYYWLRYQRKKHEYK